MNKYYKYIGIGLALIFVIIVIIIFVIKGNNQPEDLSDNLLVDINDVVFKLIGDTNYELDVNEDYIEPGFIAYLKNGIDITEFVTVSNDNIVKNGTYKIKYTLVYENIKLTLTRNIILKNNNEEEMDVNNLTENLTLKLNGEEEVYILKNNLYKEMGAFAIDKTDGNISSNVKISGTIDTNTIGEYIVTYTIFNSKQENKSIERKVIVYDYNYDININRSNGKINLIFTNVDKYVNYLTINGTAKKINDKVTNIILDDNKEYSIKLIDKYNFTKEINYNFIKPVITCNATIESNSTIVTTSTTSNNINKYNYYFNNYKYESEKNTYTISGNYDDVSVEAIDNNQNTSKVSCTVINNVPYYDSGLKELKYSDWNYYLYVPNNVKKNVKKPLIVFLHGSEERGSNLKSLDGYGFSKYIKSGQNYDAFVLIPQLPKGKYWANEIETTMNLIKKVVNDYNIDEKKISLSGFSLGAIGIPSIMEKNQNYFSCVVMIAVGGNKKGYATYFKNIPVRFYAGSKDTRLGNSSDTKAFIQAVKKVNSNVESVVYSGYPHNVVDKVLKDGNVPKWMISQTKK